MFLLMLFNDGFMMFNLCLVFGGWDDMGYCRGIMG